MNILNTDTNEIVFVSYTIDGQECASDFIADDTEIKRRYFEEDEDEREFSARATTKQIEWWESWFERMEWANNAVESLKDRYLNNDKALIEIDDLIADCGSVEYCDQPEAILRVCEEYGFGEFFVDRQKLISIFETIADFEITETKIDGYTAWLEAAADEWDGVSDIEGCDFGGSRSERDRQGYIIDWSAALVKKS